MNDDARIGLRLGVSARAEGRAGRGRLRPSVSRTRSLAPIWLWGGMGMWLAASPAALAHDRSGGPAQTATIAIKNTGLVWARCSMGQTWEGAGRCRGAVALLSFDEARRCMSGGWRIPSRDELKSLVDPRRVITIDASVFPGIDPLHTTYWTRDAIDRTQAWSYGFKRGVGFLAQAKQTRNAVLAVRDAGRSSGAPLNTARCRRDRSR